MLLLLLYGKVLSAQIIFIKNQHSIWNSKDAHSFNLGKGRLLPVSVSGPVGNYFSENVNNGVFVVVWIINVKKLKNPGELNKVFIFGLPWWFFKNPASGQNIINIKNIIIFGKLFDV